MQCPAVNCGQRTHSSSCEGELVWSHPHCSCLEASTGRILGGVHENGARALEPSGDVSWGVQSHYKADAVGCSEWGGFDGQSQCPIPLPAGMQKGDQGGLQRMSILCGHQSVGSPWEQAGVGDAGARGVLEEAAQELPVPPTVPAQLCWL